MRLFPAVPSAQIVIHQRLFQRYSTRGDCGLGHRVADPKVVPAARIEPHGTLVHSFTQQCIPLPDAQGGDSSIGATALSLKGAGLTGSATELSRSGSMSDNARALAAAR
ncbi:hypothetical protein SBA5_720005 [Candidatus Sulfotelmatomonas gaucii]|uniref:Uncharacterized protein n=1 Tax=Candidatus Sulfuritelmatomonas gaucii TaxID=2043161 RepID=A0A2N9M2X1_9BACT|nr:hypothetical protein SBA5_720005 [Candidatus Sulfotelmatomonas gaucii]